LPSFEASSGPIATQVFVLTGDSPTATLSPIEGKVTSSCHLKCSRSPQQDRSSQRDCSPQRGRSPQRRHLAPGSRTQSRYRECGCRSFFAAFCSIGTFFYNPKLLTQTPLPGP
jgi:hypothetical protein